MIASSGNRFITDCGEEEGEDIEKVEKAGDNETFLNAENGNDLVVEVAAEAEGEVVDGENCEPENPVALR